jgi:trehalose utilization protein
MLQHWGLLFVKDPLLAGVFNRVCMGSVCDMGWMDGVERERITIA